MEFRAVSYQTSAGKKPFDEWLEKLRHRDRVAAAAVDARLTRIRDKGNFGDHGTVGHPICELRLHLGPGYRVYYLVHGRETMVLLTGGLKKEQRRDIAQANEYAVDFRRRI